MRLASCVVRGMGGGKNGLADTIRSVGGEVRWETMDGEEMVKTRSQTDSEELRVAVQQAVWI